MLDVERQSLENRLRELEKSSIGTGPAPQPAVAQDPAITNASPATDKITLFLTMPISWKGTLAQYVGRLHREYHAKREVVVYDYVDSGVPMLARMALKRQSGYRGLGYEVTTK